MKFSLEVSFLRDAIQKLVGVVDKKNARPILTNCLFKTDKSQLEIIATDLEVSAKIILPANVELHGSFCINSKNIAEILRELPDDTLYFEIEQTVLKLNCRDIKYSLLIIPSEDYPQLVFGNKSDSFKMKSSQILEIINKTSHAISTDETRLYLNGIFFQIHDKKLRSVAIDGHKLALLDTAEIIGENKYLKDGIIIPRKGINELKKIAESYPDEQIDMNFDDSFMFAQIKNEYFLSIRLIAREYPKYQSVIPAKTIHSFDIQKTLLLDAVKRVKVLSNEKTNGIKLIIDQNILSLNTHHPSLGQANETISITYQGNKMEIGINAKYLLDTLSVLPEGEVRFEFNNELSPVVLKSQKLPDFLGIIMPLKL